MTGFRFPSLGLTFCPECGGELDPVMETYHEGKIEYTHQFHGTCPNSDKRFLGLVNFVECTEINMKVN